MKASVNALYKRHCFELKDISNFTLHLAHNKTGGANLEAYVLSGGTQRCALSRHLSNDIII